MSSRILYVSSAITIIICLALLSSCRTVRSFIKLAPDYSALPQEDLIKTAKYIEEKIWAGEREPNLTNISSINLDTPQIKQAIRTRAVRSELVRELLDKGFIYEQNGGLIAIQRNSAYKRSTTRQQRDKNALIVMGENNDRWALYEGIIKANNYPSKSLSAIQDAFYKARVQLLQPGHKYQTPDGKITQK